MSKSFIAELDAHLRTLQALREQMPNIEGLGQRWLAALRNGGKILLMGNGGSAADAQHIAAELVGRYLCERPALAAIALTTDTSILTSLANDYGYSTVFARQVEALATANDVVVGYSTSGSSANVLAAMEVARRIGCYTVALTGASGGQLIDKVDTCIRVASSETPRIQEAHAFIGHRLCAIVDESVNG